MAAPLPDDGKDENYYDMITISPPQVEFSDFTQASVRDSTTRRDFEETLTTRISDAEYSSFLGQNPSYPPENPLYSQDQHQRFPDDLHLHEFHYDPVMFANPNQNLKVESPDLLSPTGMGPGFRAQNQEFLAPQSVYSDAGSNVNSLFHDAASHFSGAAEPPTGYFEPPLQHQDTFNQEISLGQSISSTNLADMGQDGHATYNDGGFARDGYSNSDKFYTSEYHSNDAAAALHLGPEVPLNQENWRFEFASHNHGDNYVGHNGQGAHSSHDDTFSGIPNQYQGVSNKLTEDNLLNYNGKIDDSDTKVTISIHQAPELVAAHTPSLFSNSSHNSSPVHKHSYGENQLQPPGQVPRSRSPSLSLNPPSPSPSWNHSSSPSLSVNLPSPGGSVYSDVDADVYLKPEDYQTMRRGRQTAHHLKVRSQSHSRSRSQSGSVSGSVSGHSGSEYLDSESEYDNADSNESADAARSSREKMLELASSATVSKRTQIHPSSYACHLCEKKFTRPYNLKSHLRTHTDDRPFICNICGKAFARQHDRKRHEELHSGEKKYQCRGLLRDGTPFGCGRKFARADALRRHFQTESGKECIKLLVEEDAREQNTDTSKSGIQLPDGEFMNPNCQDVPLLSVSPPQ
ncbi:hypothetical protein JCM33374_g1497 [Metschnikowia sp. JCM 33374]|nr:hypothetical protein JCM33374_g1497 [Metschnikowia sp. JCM 33374]